MKIIICGAGEVGFSIAKYLENEGDIDITVIDDNVDRLHKISNSIDVTTLKGKVSSPKNLSNAGASDADMLIAVTDSDEINIVTCEIADILFNITTTIARVREKDYMEKDWDNLFSTNGLKVSNIISPEEEVASMLARMVAISGAHDLLSFSEDKVRLIGVRLDESCPVINTPLEQLTELFPDLNSKVVLIVRKEKLIVPNKLSQMLEGDDVYLIADSDNTKRVLSIFGKESRQTRKIVIIGGGRISISIASILEKNEPNAKVTIIERNKEKAEYAASNLKKALVLHGDALEKEIMQEARIEDSDIVFSVTDSDEINTLVSMLSKKAGAKSSFALLNGSRYQSLIPSLNIDGVISPRELTVSRVIKHLRRGRVLTVHELIDGAAEVIEFRAEESSKLIGIPLKDAKLPEEISIGAIVREEEVIVPKADTVIQKGDRVVVLSLHEAVHKLETLFSVAVGFF